MFWLKLEKNKQFNNINTIEFKTIDKQMYKGIIIIDFQTYSLKQFITAASLSHVQNVNTNIKRDF